jgi:hypothetical protein
VEAEISKKEIGGHFKILMFIIIVVFNDNFHQNIWDDTSFICFFESNSLIINFVLVDKWLGLDKTQFGINFFL